MGRQVGIYASEKDVEELPAFLGEATEIATLSVALHPRPGGRRLAAAGGGDGHLVVTSEMRRGYTLNDRVIRPTLVHVAAEDVGQGEPKQ